MSHGRGAVVHGSTLHGPPALPVEPVLTVDVHVGRHDARLDPPSALISGLLHFGSRLFSSAGFGLLQPFFSRPRPQARLASSGGARRYLLEDDDVRTCGYCVVFSCVLY